MILGLQPTADRVRSLPPRAAQPHPRAQLVDLWGQQAWVVRPTGPRASWPTALKSINYLPTALEGEELVWQALDLPFAFWTCTMQDGAPVVYIGGVPRPAQPGEHAAIVTLHR